MFYDFIRCQISLILREIGGVWIRVKMFYKNAILFSLGKQFNYFAYKASDDDLNLVQHSQGQLF